MKDANEGNTGEREERRGKIEERGIAGLGRNDQSDYHFCEHVRISVVLKKINFINPICTYPDCQ